MHDYILEILWLMTEIRTKISCDVSTFFLKDKKQSFSLEFEWAALVTFENKVR
jgi:hypothetical protein